VDTSPVIDPLTGPTTAQGLARTLRHEVGDLLQTLYSTVAVLNKRLPADCEQERALLANLRARGEACRMLLDTAHDFVCAVTLSYETVNLGNISAALVETIAPRYPHLAVVAENVEPVHLQGDARRLAQMGNLLLVSACEVARQRVQSSTAVRPDTDEIEWSVTDDEPGVPADALDGYFHCFAPTRSGRLGLGLGPARKVAIQHGGSVSAVLLPEGGFRVRVMLPRTPPNDAENAAHAPQTSID
jgi:K+-sensing histidine kinase KdpD